MQNVESPGFRSYLRSKTRTGDEGLGDGILFPSGLTWHLLRGTESILRDLEEEWEILCESEDVRYGYLRPKLLRVHLSAFSPGTSLTLIVARQAGELMAIFPLEDRTNGFDPISVRWLRSASNRELPHLDVICRDSDTERVARDLWRLFREMKGWDVLQIDTVPSGGAVDQLRELAGQEGRRIYLHNPTRVPFIEIPASRTIHEVIEKQHRSLRKQLRRDLRKLEELGDIRLVEGGGEGAPDHTASCYQRFLDLEHDTWKGRESYSIRSRREMKVFYDNLFHTEGSEGRWRVHLLTCDGEIVSGALGLVSGTTYYGIRIAFNERYRRYSPGHLLLLHQIHALGRRGYTTIDMGRNDSPEKMAWTSSTHQLGTPFIFNHSLRGRIAHFLIVKAAPTMKSLLKEKWTPKVSHG